MRVNSARSCRNARASATAARCAAATRSRVGWSASAHRTLADLVSVKVRSNPATATGVCRLLSACSIRAIAAARSSGPRSLGSFAKHG